MPDVAFNPFPLSRLVCLLQMHRIISLRQQLLLHKPNRFSSLPVNGTAYDLHTFNMQKLIIEGKCKNQHSDDVSPGFKFAMRVLGDLEAEERRKALKNKHWNKFRDTCGWLPSMTHPRFVSRFKKLSSERFKWSSDESARVPTCSTHKTRAKRIGTTKYCSSRFSRSVLHAHNVLLLSVVFADVGVFPVNGKCWQKATAAVSFRSFRHSQGILNEIFKYFSSSRLFCRWKKWN